MSLAEHVVVDALNRRCQCVGTDVRALHSWLDHGLRSRGVVEPLVATHPHLFSTLPVFVANEQVIAMRRVIAAIEFIVGLPAYRDAVLSHAPPISRQAPSARGVFLGYDFHLSSAGPKLIEINTNAGGAMLNVAMTRAQQACCPEVAEFLRTQPDTAALEEQMFAMFANEWRLSRGDRALRTVAIVDESPRAQYLYPEFLLFQRMFEARGLRAVIAAPEEFSYREDGLWWQGERIELLYNRLTDFYLQAPASSALAQAYLDDTAVITPHPHAHALYANKHNLVLLTNERALREMAVPSDVIATVLAGIPQTLSVQESDAEWWWADRKHWFFKPATGFGSRGSYRGDKLTRKAFADIVRGDYVAQRLALPSERWLSSEAGSALKFDVRNYVYDGATQLMAARLYQGQTTNFRTPGGGFAPVYSLASPISSMPSAA